MERVDAILVSDGPGERRVASLSGGILVDYDAERDGEAGATAMPGAIHRGRVIGRLPAGTLVELGQGPPALVKEAGLSPGQSVVVQVTKAAAGGKGPQASLSLWLAGQGLAVGTGGPSGVEVARAAGGPARRGRLRVLLNDGLPAGRAVRVLAPAVAGVAGDGAGDDDAAALVAERDRLVARLETVLARRGEGCLLPAPGLLEAVAAAHPDARIQIDGPALRARLPGATLAPPGLFAALDVDGQLAAACAREVALPGGGSLVIEPTAALVAVDVNAGPSDSLTAARAAVRPVARQIRLRRLAGLVLVDFPRLPVALRRQIAAALAEELAGLGEVLGHTRGGLLEIQVPRRRPPLAELLGSPEARALAALRAVLAAAPRRPPVLRLAPAVAEAAAAHLPALEARLGLPVTVLADAAIPGTGWAIEAGGTGP
ncbi:MAG: ribonuclease E/G [Thalassobaculales bacterium]